MNLNAYEETILNLLSGRERGKTICPSEVLGGPDKKDPAKMEQVRAAARRLEARGIIEITQRGQAIDSAQIKGPIRLRFPVP